MAKVLVGMSGGVDSSVAAKVLLDSGYDVTGVTLKMFSSDDIVEEHAVHFQTWKMQERLRTNLVLNILFLISKINSGNL